MGKNCMKTTHPCDVKGESIEDYEDGIVTNNTLKLCVVQFPHPGQEPTLARANRKHQPIVHPWNQGSHKRKFMKALGQTVDSNGAISSKKELLFWGEWEPTSLVEPITQWQGNGVQPKWLHLPFLHTGATKVTPQTGSSIRAATSGGAGCAPNSNGINTDPLIFGDYFIYSNCRQARMGNNGKIVSTIMQSLQPGSIILFGSKLSDSNKCPYFALDTVFVVGEARKYVASNYKNDLKGFVHKDFAKIMGHSFIKGTSQFTCYHGATVTNPVDGMFSFVPCKTYPGVNIGFPRPKLVSQDFAPFNHKNKNIISNGLSRIYHYTVIPNIQTSRMIWNAVCNIIQQQGYERGVNLNY